MDAQERARLRALCDALQERRVELDAVLPGDLHGLTHALNGFMAAKRHQEAEAGRNCLAMLDALDACEASLAELKASSALTIAIRLFASMEHEDGIIGQVYGALRSTAEMAYQLGVEEGLRRAAALAKEAEDRRVRCSCPATSDLPCDVHGIVGIGVMPR